jgi:3-hydroxyisobutyrate dehydrogenase-like beta-hydroxyacid dehydrogenase
VSVLGLGGLGGALAAAFLQHGHATTVWNRSPGRLDDLVAAGAVPAAAAAGAVGSSPVVVTAVSTYDDVRAVLEPADDALAGRVLVNLASGTPEQARALAAWAQARGAAYLDGAAMSGTRPVGTDDAFFLYAGPSDAFAAAEPALVSLGRAVHLGDDPGVSSLYDTALLGMNMGVLTGFYQAVALVGAAGVGAADFASVALGYLPFATGLLSGHARQIDEGRYPPDEGTLEVLAAAMDHVAGASRAVGVSTELPDAVREVLARGIASGHGDHGVASLAEIIGAAGNREAVPAGRP